MTCRRPLEAVRKVGSGERPVVYKKFHRPTTLREGYEALELPCGQCISCRLERSRIWAARMIHHAAYLEEFYGLYSSFITLTYDEENLPFGGTLVKEHPQNFMKRLRWHLGPNKISHYYVGEYGSCCPDHEIVNCPMCGPIQRPHYHAIIFGGRFLIRRCLAAVTVRLYMRVSCLVKRGNLEVMR